MLSNKFSTQLLYGIARCHCSIGLLNKMLLGQRTKHPNLWQPFTSTLMTYLTAIVVRAYRQQNATSHAPTSSACCALTQRNAKLLWAGPSIDKLANVQIKQLSSTSNDCEVQLLKHLSTQHYTAQSSESDRNLVSMHRFYARCLYDMVQVFTLAMVNVMFYDIKLM